MSGEALIRVGLITKTRGLRGELSVVPLTDDPERFRRLDSVYIEKPVAVGSSLNAHNKAQNRSFAVLHGNIENVIFHRGQVIVKFEGCDDVDAAQAFRGAYISITADQLVPLDKDSYFVFDLIGCAVYDTDGGCVGELTDVLKTGSNDVYIVKPAAGLGGENGNGDILVPALKTVVREIDIVNKRVVIDYDL